MAIFCLFTVLTLVIFCTCMPTEELTVDPRDPVAYDVTPVTQQDHDGYYDDYYDTDNSTEFEEIYTDDLDLEDRTSELEVPEQSLQLRAVPEDAEVFGEAWDPGDPKDPTFFKDPGDLRNPTHFRDPPTHIKDPPVVFQKPSLPEPGEVEVIQPSKQNQKKKNDMRVVMVRPQKGNRNRKRKQQQQQNRRRLQNRRPNNTRPLSGFMVNGTRPVRGPVRPGVRRYHIIRLNNNRKKTNINVRMGNMNRRKQKNRKKGRPAPPLQPPNTPSYFTGQPSFPSAPSFPSFPAVNPPFPSNSDSVPFRLVQMPSYDFHPDDDDEEDPPPPR